MQNEPVQKNRFYWAYMAGFFLVLTLPLFVAPPMFYPPDWGKTIVFRIIMAVLLFLFAFQFLLKRREISLPEIKHHKTLWIFGGLAGVILLSIFFSADWYFSLWGSPYRAGGAVNLFFYGVFAILAFFIIKKSDWTKLLKYSIGVGIAASAVAVIQLYGLFSSVIIPVPGRPPATMGNPILLAIYLLLLLFITISFAIKEKNMWWKAYYGGVALLFTYIIIMTGSRAAYLGLLFGGIYFALLYPKKMLAPKLAVGIALLAGVTGIYYVNTAPAFPLFLESNKIFQAVKPRLYIKSALNDPRFSAWKITVEAIKERPLLGWGPENFSIGFDKYYQPSLPYISKAWGGWWDRPHNILLDVAVSSGLVAMGLYLALFGALFWQLQKLKAKPKETTALLQNSDPTMAHGIQAALVGYFVANIFSFDGFSSYLLFFLLIGYCLRLTLPANVQIIQPALKKNGTGKKVLVGIFALGTAIFLWQCNIKPLQINDQIQKAGFLAAAKKCDQVFGIMDAQLKKSSFLNAYARIKYLEYIKACAQFFPQKNLEYTNRGAEVLQEALTMRPEYARLWLFWGSFTTIKASVEQDPLKKEALITEANLYFEKAKELAPSHQEILVEQAKADMVSGNYEGMSQKASACVALDKSLGDCYWIKALSQIYLKRFDVAKEYIFLAGDHRYNTAHGVALHQLANAYAAAENYPELVAIYKRLILENIEEPTYHASLSFTYSKMKEYAKARQEALIFLEMMPEAKEEVELFLKTLPY